MSTEAIALKGGLDLRHAKPIVKPGRLIDCKNYEATTDVDGYKPFDGFERFDGRMSPSTRDIWKMTVPGASITGTFTAGENMTWTLDGESGDVGVVAVYATSGIYKDIYFSYWLAADYLPDGATVTGDDSGATFTYSAPTHTLQHVTAYATGPSNLFSELNTIATALRSKITGVPGQGPVLGHKRFEGATYAVRNFFSFGFDGGGTVEPETYQRILDASGNEGIFHLVTLSSGDWGAGTAAGTITIDAYDAAFAVADNDQLDLVGEIQFSSGSTEPSAGDTITGQISLNTATVHRVRLDSGTWAGGDAAGVIYIVNESGAFTATENIDNTTAAAFNVLTCDEQTHTSQDAFIDATAATANQALAGLWKNSRTGWSRVELDWELTYDTGTNAPDIINLGGSAADAAASAMDTGWLTGAAVSQGGSTAESWSSLTAGNLNADDGSEATVTTTTYTSSYAVYLTGFPISLDPSDTPLGFELEFRVYRSAGTKTAGFSSMCFQLGNTGMPSERTAYRADSTYHINTGTEYTHTVGGTADDWGGWVSGSDITADDCNDSNFSVRFKLSQLGTGATTYNVDRVRIRITYLPAGSKVYFWDGSADRGSAVVTQDVVTTGAYSSNDAAGTLSLSDLTRYDFGSGIEIRTAAAGGGTLISVTTSAPTRVTMAGSTLLDAEASKYQWMVANFYASDQLNALWGVSGAGLAFVYDGTFFRQIRSGILEADDKPRHLASFQFRLILGYAWGEEAWSVAASPLTFDGTLNAVATGYGFPIVGIKELNGQMLATFTTGGVFGTIVSGADFEQKILAPKSKVIEYSVQDFGDDTVWLDQNGVRTLTSTQKYGDFESGTLSLDVNKWLRKRLRREALISPRNGNFVDSTVIRSKGQYRMFFADGQVLTMTWNIVEEPEFTWQKLWLDNDETDAYVRVGATSSDVDDDGTEHVYFSVAERDDYDHGADLGYVFQSERGTSFDGDAIDAYCTVSFLNVGNPVINKRFNQWQVHGEAYSYATPTIDFAVDLTVPDGSGAETLRIGSSTGTPTIELEPFFAKARSQKRGRNISVKFAHNSSTELPHLLQLLFPVDPEPGRKEI